MSTAADRPRASDRAYATLLEEIQSGALAPGTILAETEQAVRLGVSRTPLREALQQLGADGLVAQQSPRVTVVTAIDADDIRALFEIRRALEETSARLAAVRGDATVFAGFAEDFAHVRLDAGEASAAGRGGATEPAQGAGRARTALSGAADAGTAEANARDSYYALISRFDRAVDDAVANDYLTSALRTVRTHLVRVRRLARDKPERLARSVAEHRLIAAALAARDPDLAAHATHVHLHNALAGILDSLPSESEGTP